ncbi:hypothetical protein CYANOKiyG1_76220 [Okeania sp. KiyG1]|nr:hypothetical protein CYANOKiyG1_76220 [Okeania sp. KiyG1]
MFLTINTEQNIPLFTEKLWSKTSPCQGIKKDNIPDVNSNAFLGHAAQTARGTDN